MTVTVNADLMLEVANMIERFPDNFNMVYYWPWDINGDAMVFAVPITGTPNECGTTACVAGWAATLAGFRREALHLDGFEELHVFARNTLGLTEAQAMRVFLDWVDREPEDIIRDLRFIAKGDLVWSEEREDWVPNV